MAGRRFRSAKFKVTPLSGISLRLTSRLALPGNITEQGFLRHD